MPGPFNREASRGGPAPGASWADDTVDVRDLDPLFDLSVFPAEGAPALAAEPVPPPAPPQVAEPEVAARPVAIFPRPAPLRAHLPLPTPVQEHVGPEAALDPRPELRGTGTGGARSTRTWTVVGASCAALLGFAVIAVLLRSASSGSARQVDLAEPRATADNREPQTADMARSVLTPPPAATGRSPVKTGGRTADAPAAPVSVSRGAPLLTGVAAGAARTRVFAPSGKAAAQPTAPGPEPLNDATPALAGRVRIEAPVELQMSIDGKAAGTTQTARTLLAAGSHQIEFASDRAGFRTTQNVMIEAGQVTTVRVDVPTGWLSVDSQPGGDVFVDGRAVGTTPIERLVLSVGVRQVIIRHSEAGDRSYEVVVREGQHTSLSADLQPR